MLSPEGFQQNQAPPKCFQQLFAQTKSTLAPTAEPEAPPPTPISRISSVRSAALEEAQLAVTLAASASSTLGADLPAQPAQVPAMAEEVEETPLPLALEAIADADAEGDTNEVGDASALALAHVAAPADADCVRYTDMDERVWSTDTQGEVPTHPPIAASMLSDFLQMSAKADGNEARVFVDHESTRCTYRVRNRTLGGSRVFKYDAGDAKSQEKAKTAADAYCAECCRGARFGTLHE